MLNLHTASIITLISGIAVLDTAAAPTDITGSGGAGTRLMRRDDLTILTTSTRSGTAYYTLEGDDNPNDPVGGRQGDVDAMFGLGECQLEYTNADMDGAVPPVWIPHAIGLGTKYGYRESFNDLCGKKITLKMGAHEKSGIIAGEDFEFCIPKLTMAQLAGFDDIPALTASGMVPEKVLHFDIED